MNLNDKVCLVTGGTRGIGAATAELLAEAGANLSLVARRWDDEARNTERIVKNLGRACLTIAADLSKPSAAAACVEKTARELGGVDVLIHCAGGPVNGGLLEIAPQAWHEAFDLHVHAVFYLCRAVLPLMQRKHEGAIVLVSSVAGLRALRTNVAYQAVKGALPHLARSLAYEFADDNIRVNCVAPGIVRTAFHAQMPAAVRQHNLNNRVPLHREGTAREVAAAICELVRNDYITGETLSIDGGLGMRIC